MAARSESLSVWQCCGCKATFPNEKNAKLHVAYHAKARPGAPAGPAARVGAAARGPGPPAGRAGGHPSTAATGTRRPERRASRQKVPTSLGGDQSGSVPGCHWPAGIAAGGAKMQRIVIDRRPGGPGPGGGTSLQARIQAITYWPGPGDSEAPRAPGSATGGPGPGPGPAGAPPARLERDLEALGSLGSDSDGQEPTGDSDKGGYYSSDEEPGKQYIVQNYAI